MRDAGSPFADPTRRPRLGRRALGFGCLALATAVSLLGSPAAHAIDIHTFDASFSVAAKTTNPNSMAVDKASGVVYLMSMGGTTPAGDILKYDAEGNLQNFSALGTSVLDTPCAGACRSIAVDNSGGSNQGVIYVSRQTTGASAEIAVYLPSGTKVASIKKRSVTADTSAFCGVATDNAGNVFAAHSTAASTASIDEFQPLAWEANPAQEPAPTATIRPLDIGTPCKMAADSTKALAVKTGSGSTEAGTVRRFPGSAFGPPIEPFSPGTSTLITASPARDVAADISNDNFYVTKGEEVLRFDPSNVQLEHFGAAQLTTSAQGVAVNSETGSVYVSDPSTDEVSIYKEIDAAIVSLDPAGEVLQFTAEVSGDVDPDGAGEVTDCQFEYVTDATFKASGFAAATKKACGPAVPYAAPQAVSAELTGLVTETTYRFRLAATNAEGTNFTEPQAFITHAVQDLVTEAATEVGPREATLNASFTGIGEDTDYFFQYGPTASYGSTTATESLEGPSGHTEVSTEIEGLELESTYHFRIVAKNSSGTTVGEDMEFTTHPAVAGVLTSAASEIGQDTITLNGEFEGNGEQTSYYFEYGPTTKYGLLSEPPPGSDAGSPVGTTTVSSEIPEYEGYTEYHYRLVAVNSFGTTYGPDETFTTPDAPLPVISGVAATGVTPTGAELSASINPNRWPTVYRFEWGPTTSYGASTLLSDVIGGLDNDEHPVSAEVSGLNPASVYHFRVAAINFTGVTFGPDQAFITPDLPRVQSTSSSAVTQTRARLGARVAANASPTAVHFQYGTSLAYGGSTAPAPIGSDLFPTETGADISGLAAGTTYHFRAVATNAIGTVYGPDQVLSTPAGPQATRPPAAGCRNLARAAKRNADHAKALRRKALRSSNAKRKQTLRKKAARSAKKARQLSNRAKSCKGSGGGNT